MSSRNFVTLMKSKGRLDGGFYKCDLTYTNPVSQTALTQEFVTRVQNFAAASNGQLESRVVLFPSPAILEYSDVYTFLNKESMLLFAQEVGYLQTSRAIEFQIDYASLQALL